MIASATATDAQAEFERECEPAHYSYNAGNGRLTNSLIHNLRITRAHGAQHRVNT